MKKAMLDGAKFALSMGDQNTAATYSQTATLINATLLSNHWMSSNDGDDDGYVFESDNRLKDGAVIVGFNDGYTLDDGLFGPTSFEVAATVRSECFSLFFHCFHFFFIAFVA